MKMFKFLLIFLLCEKFFVPFCESKNCSRSLACAFEEIAKSISNQSWEIPIVNFGADVAFVDSLIPKNFHDANLTFKVTNVKKISRKEKALKLNKSAVTIFDSVKTLGKYNKNVEFTNTGPKEFQFFVHVPKTTIKEIAASIAELFIYDIRLGLSSLLKPTETINSQYFIVDEEKFIKLYTFEWFIDEKTCGLKHKVAEVNRFDKKTKKWQTLSFNLEKFMNFHGCDLNFMSEELYGEIELDFARFKVDADHPHGFLYDIFKDLEKEFNFKLKFVDDESIKNRFKPTQMVIMNDCLPPSLREKSHLKFHLSQPFFSAKELLAVPPGEEYSAYEKLKFPFDNST
jgi:hypothetical protein